MENILSLFTRYKYDKKKERFLWRLNLRITGCVIDGKNLGWIAFFSQSEDIVQLKRLDSFIVKQFASIDIKYDSAKTKKIVKSYYEHRYNIKESKYIPNFDEYSRQNKIDMLCKLLGKNYDDVELWDDEEIERVFKKTVRKETSRLEVDMFESIS
jgi:RNA-directed DNA polymerase